MLGEVQRLVRMDVGVKAPKWEKSLMNMVKYLDKD